jgi:hypothetical protein
VVDLVKVEEGEGEKKDTSLSNFTVKVTRLNSETTDIGIIIDSSTG